MSLNVWFFMNLYCRFLISNCYIMLPLNIILLMKSCLKFKCLNLIFCLHLESTLILQLYMILNIGKKIVK